MNISFSKNKVVNMDGGNSESGTVSILMMGDVGYWWEINKEDVYAQLRGVDCDNINVYICTKGGDVSHAFAIYDFLKGHKATVNAHLFGECMSAGTIIANAADRITMSKTCVYMGHKGAMGAYGNAKYLRKTAAEIDTYDAIITDMFVSKMGISAEAVSDFLDEEFYLTASQALEAGLVDEIVDGVSVDFDIDETHGAAMTDAWGEWYGYIKDRQTTDAKYAYQKQNIKAMASSRLSQITSVPNHKNMGFFSKIANAMGFTITDKDGKEVNPETLDEQFTKEAVTAAGQDIFNAQKEVVMSAIREPLSAQIEAFSTELAAIKNSIPAPVDTSVIDAKVNELDAKIAKVEALEQDRIKAVNEAKTLADKAAEKLAEQKSVQQNKEPKNVTNTGGKVSYNFKKQ